MQAKKCATVTTKNNALPTTRWAFVDLENVGSLETLDLARYQRIIVFLGANQHQLKLGAVQKDMPILMTLIPIKGVSPNNLDLHLAFYLGAYDQEAPKHICFDVISNDKDYASLVAHIPRARGRVCNIIETPPSPKKDANSPPPDKSKKIFKETSHALAVNKGSLHLLEKRIQALNLTNRAKKVPALTNQIQSWLTTNDVDQAKGYIKSLEKKRIIQIKENKVTYLV